MTTKWRGKPTVTDPADQDRFPCPNCQRSLSAGARSCPHCGSGIAIVHVREKGAMVKRFFAVHVDGLEDVGDFDDFEIDDPPGGEG